MPRPLHLSLICLGLLSLGFSDCVPHPPPGPDGPPGLGAQLFQSPQVNAIALADDGRLLLVANTTSGTLSIYRTRILTRSRRRPFGPDPARALLAEIRVGIDPVGIAVRPPAFPGDRRLALVSNHISDSISVVDLDRLGVVQTLQELDADGVTTTDAPTGVVFAGPSRAFVALDDRNEVLVVDFDAAGHASLNPERLAITAQAPRAMTVVGDRLLVGAFESGNQTEFPNCGPLETSDTRGFTPGAPDEGCQFYNRFLDDLVINDISNDNLDIDLDFGVIVDFAARNPNIGGEVIVDSDLPDRDILVFDTQALGDPVQVLEGVSTLLYGLASQGQRVWVTSTDGRNHLDGLEDLENRMFENRLSWFDCAPDCGAPLHRDLDQNPHGVPVPTPYGIRASGDGQVLVVSVSGSDGIPGLPEDPATDIPGLVTLDAEGNVLGHVQTGAIPQAVALASDAAGAARTAYVLNTVDSTVSVVDVRDPADPRVTTTFPVGNDPTPEEIRRGRALFMSARASTSGTFSCESCHPSGNTDQLIWTINTVAAPTDFEPPCDSFADACPEPRTTMPTPRGLRDTLPLHWLGNLADPFSNPEDEAGMQIALFQPEDDGAPDCDIEVVGEVGCARHLVNASLSGVMCDPTGGCAPGPSGDPGALTNAERDAMAAFLLSVSYPPSPTRRPDDALSDLATQGVSDFFTDEDQLGVGSTASTLGQAVGFAPITCADNSGGCHALPLGVGTNSRTVGNFDAPTMRGLWDRHVQFSNGNPSAEEVLAASELCAKGSPPGDHPILGDFLTGDPCALSSPFIETFLGFSLDPFQGVPSGEDIYDPAVGVTERGVFLSTFESLFHLAYGVRGAPMWEFFKEMSVGFSGLYGRQLTAGPADVLSPATQDALGELMAAADVGKIALVASYLGEREWRYEPADGRWHRARPWPVGSISTDLLLQGVIFWNQVVTFTAHLKEGVSIGGADRQPLLDVDPDERANEAIGDLLAIPRPAPAGGDVMRLGALYVDPDATVLVDGAPCPACSFVGGSTENGPYVDLTLALALPLGVHVVQVLNPNGWASNEMPVLVTEPPPPDFQMPQETIDCLVDAGCFFDADPLACAAASACRPVPANMGCSPVEIFPDCAVCLIAPDCSDGSCTPIGSIVGIDLVPGACPEDPTPPLPPL